MFYSTTAIVTATTIGNMFTVTVKPSRTTTTNTMSRGNRIDSLLPG